MLRLWLKSKLMQPYWYEIKLAAHWFWKSFPGCTDCFQGFGKVNFRSQFSWYYGDLRLIQATVISTMSWPLVCCQEATSCTSRPWILLDLQGLGSQLLILLHKSEEWMQWGGEVELEPVQSFVSVQWGVWMGIIILCVSPPSLAGCLTGSRVDSSTVWAEGLRESL